MSKEKRKITNLTICALSDRFESPEASYQLTRFPLFFLP
jgi:hypothetical protein